jgi:hypothetical protein
VNLAGLAFEGIAIAEDNQHQQRRIMNPDFGAAELHAQTVLTLEKTMELWTNSWGT